MRRPERERALRTKGVNVRVTEEEHALIDEAAWRSRERISSWARRVLAERAQRELTEHQGRAASSTAA